MKGSGEIRRALFAPNNHRLFRSHLPVVRALLERGVEAIAFDLAGPDGDRFPAADSLDPRLRIERLDHAVPPYRGERWLRRRRMERSAHREIGRAAAEALGRIEPDVVVLTNNQAVAPFLIAATAKRMGIPVVVVQPGIVLPESERARARGRRTGLKKTLLRLANRVYATAASGRDRLAGRPSYPPGGPRCFGAGPADLVTVLGPHYARQFTGEGLPPARIRVAGNPLYDVIFTDPPLAGWPQAAASLGIDPAATVVVFTTQPNVELGLSSPAEREETVRAVVGGVLGNDEVDRLVVKVHPAEEVTPYLRPDEPRVIVTRDAPLYPLLAGAACAVTGFSTTGLEAVLLGTGLVSLDLHGKPMGDLYARLGLGRYVRSEADLTRAVAAYLGSPDKRDRAVAADFGRAADLVTADGRATDRVLEVVGEAVGG